MSKLPDLPAALRWTQLATLGAIALVTLFRIAPHPWNVTPVGAMFVLGGLYLGRSLAWMAVPFAGLLISDTVLNLAYDGRPVHLDRMVDYLAFALIAVVARWTAEKPLAARVGVVVGAPIAFFLISNFGIWLGGGLYPHTLSGLADCYALALPFFRGTLVGDWLFAGLGLLALESVRARVTHGRAAAA